MWPKAPEGLGVILMVDDSGSMDGRPAAAARDAVRAIASSLPETARLDVMLWGSSTEVLYGGPQFVTARVRREVTTMAEQKIQAQHGGTDMLAALREMEKRMPQAAGRRRVVIVLTDGAVWNTEEVLRAVRDLVGGAMSPAGAAMTSVHAVGLGSGASHGLVDGVAAAGRGVARYVDVYSGSPSVSLAAVMADMLDLALRPQVDAYEVTVTALGSAGGVELRAATTTPPVAVLGVPALWFAFGDAAAAIAASQGGLAYRVTGTVGGVHAFEVVGLVPPSALTTGTAAHRMAARAAISELEEVRAAKGHRPKPRAAPGGAIGSMMATVTWALGALSGGDAGATGDAAAEAAANLAEAKAALRQLGVAYSLASSETSFVGVREGGAGNAADVLPVLKLHVPLHTPANGGEGVVDMADSAVLSRHSAPCHGQRWGSDRRCCCCC